MKTLTFSLILVVQIFISQNLFAQKIIDFNSIRTENTKVNSSRSDILTTPAAGMFSKNDIKNNSWDVSFTHLGIKHASDVPENKVDSIRHQKTMQKLALENKDNNSLSTYDKIDGENTQKITSVVPVVSAAFKGNTHNGYVPPDNDIAVSDNGHIVSVVNSSIFFSDNNGNSVFETSFSNFFSQLGLTGSYFDPKILYDPSEDKFILVVLNGTTPFNSTVVVAFSSTSNPNDSWWFYTFSGNPLFNGTWFDFPTIGISNKELYISGNLFNSNNIFDQAIIYQIDKTNGFSGGSISSLYWYDIRDSYGYRDFTVAPISYGFDGTIGPGIYFLSSDSGGGNNVMLHWTTETIANNPSLEVNSISVPTYSLGGSGLQLGTNKLLSTNDTRMQSGFFADGLIHFVMNSERSNGYNGIYYGRIDLSSLTATVSTFGQIGYEYTFPSIAPFTSSSTDKTVVIGFLRTGSSIYPEFRVVTCDENWDWSSSVQIKGGETYVDFIFSNPERWGDYSGIARRHLNNGVEVWLSGSYGENFDNGFSNVLGTWIGKVSQGTTQQAPLANFSANQTFISAGQQVNFNDLSSNNPTNWQWSFPGGTPNTSTSQFPSITYNTPGSYNVTLVASNNAGNDSETKNGYIVVNPSGQAPMANFNANQTIITEGQQVSFYDLSSNNTSNWVWSFPGGTPNTSVSQSPNITYNTAGTYNVTLVASNNFGNDSETKNGYITVNPGSQSPQADFEADNTSISSGGIVKFTDLSSNNPVNWVWSFPGGTPSSSELQNPIIVYTSSGIYDVSLVSSNQFGNDATTKQGYITVDITNSTSNNSSKINDFKIFPNPSKSDERISVQFDVMEMMELEFFVVDNQGRVVGKLFNDRVKKGSNLISFNGDMLVPGTYFLIIQNNKNQIIKNGKFIIH